MSDEIEEALEHHVEVGNAEWVGVTEEGDVTYWLTDQGMDGAKALMTQLAEDAGVSVLDAYVELLEAMGETVDDEARANLADWLFDDQ